MDKLERFIELYGFAQPNELLVYVSSPYGAPTAAERRENARAAAEVARELRAAGWMVVHPWWEIVNTDDAETPETREAALAACALAAYYVGREGGSLVVAGGRLTPGMRRELTAFCTGRLYEGHQPPAVVDNNVHALDRVGAVVLVSPIPDTDFWWLLDTIERLWSEG